MPNVADDLEQLRLKIIDAQKAYKAAVEAAIQEFENAVEGVSVE